MPDILKNNKEVSTKTSLLRLIKRLKYIALVAFLIFFIITLQKEVSFFKSTRALAFEQSNIFFSLFSSIHDKIFFTFFSNYKDSQQIIAENQRLKYQIIQLQILKDENEKLRRNINLLDDNGISDMVTSKVLGINLSDYDHSIIINGGESDYNVNNFVIYENGLLGKIVDQSKKYSKVMLITDPNFRVSAITSKSGIRCIIAGNGSKELDLILSEHDIELQDGEYLITSGDGASMQTGIYIGNINIVKNTAVINNSIDLQKLEYVFVLNKQD